MPRSATLLLLVAAGAAGARPLPAQVGQDYALATCLTQRATGPLRDEGFHLGAIAVADAGRSPLDFAEVRQAVARELARRPMTTVHVDGPVNRSDRPALLAHCVSVARSPAVVAALAKLRR